MPLKTTVVGSYPKPEYLATPDWFKGQRSDDDQYSPEEYNQFVKGTTPQEREALQTKATKEAIDTQVQLGLSVITDGEMARENYVHHFCRKLEGIDFNTLTATSARDGAIQIDLPTICGRVEPATAEPWCAQEWEKAQKMTDTSVKMTLPGPMTITDTCFNKFYQDRQQLGSDLVKCINREVLALEEAGCKFIQIDEPLMVRNPAVALQYGIKQAAQCFQGLGKAVFKTVHVCCGYPSRLDQKDYKKADKGAYLQLAEELDNAGFDAVSIEDAHRHNDLSLFDKFKKTTVILGVVEIASSRVETTDEIRVRVQEVMGQIPAEKLWLAPDCGLGFLPPDILKQKLKNMVTVANEF